ncbi:CDP-glycerol glycerophosphotransferase family protein [Dorea acetigenes]|uniref:CDP-glycerol glycerophosphotransferase family protein n=1 Tax=Dorea acetigenes TaxID=2981787 RepID=A0ABT2RNN3_9FIRM|nr:CDP-glycerol glycerophosphotransferase family protein [Dorea acetigenes]MCB6415157.1 CDP-glycerol glycerophosphotransferase family protein [Faecalimonas umbilicata]MCU6686956.1 CDP-glycerol glycerophosphotransferase family protein [Dorea acetigenes]SCJ18937.1 CDP-glycerol:poly(glycerophosphate) glycerophosphotransferase [uncultured Clostridium sp.]
MIKRIKNKVKRTFAEQRWLILREKTSVDEFKIFFESFSASSFQGNVYYIFKRYFDDVAFLDFTFVIAAKVKTSVITFLKSKNLYDGRVKVIEYLSEEYIKELYSSKYIFNNVTFPMDFVKKTEQVYVNTWHGTPLKYIGKRASEDALIVQNMQRDFLMCDYLLSPNPFTTEIYNKDFNVSGVVSNGIQEIGYPRNEIFYNEVYRKNEREKLGFGNKKVIFYMPTWRNANGKSIDFIQKMERLADKLGEQYLIYVKLHPLDTSDRSQMKKIQYIPENYEVYEFLQCCDILITDYSSVLFDFLNTKRPIVLYQFDREEYYKSRGVYKEIEQLIEIPIAMDIDTLAELVKKEVCSSERLKEIFCPYDAGEPIAKITKIVFDLPRRNQMPICNLVVIDEADADFEQWNVDDDGNKTWIFLIPKRKNLFFQKNEKIVETNFIVGSSCGQYTLKERLAMLLVKIFPYVHLRIITQKAYQREKCRMLGNMRVHRVYQKNAPEYLKNLK